MTAVPADDVGLAAFNALAPERARADLRGCNAARGWAEMVERRRPYGDRGAVLAAAGEASADLSDADVDEGLAAHPRIGRPAAGGRWSREEQSGVRRADEALALGNRDYERRFGRRYLVCATGLDGEHLLADLRGRLDNDDDTERRVVAGELAKIARLRVAKLLDELGAERERSIECGTGHTGPAGVRP